MAGHKRMGIIGGLFQRRERLVQIALFTLLLMCYTYVLPRWADPNQNSRLDMVVAVVVVPLLAGGGMRVKILNALAAGIPIVSTSLGCEGIQVTPGQDILLGDTPEAFAAQVLRVLEYPDLGRQLAANGRKLLQERYDYRCVCRRLDEVYARAASNQ